MRRFALAVTLVASTLLGAGSALGKPETSEKFLRFVRENPGWAVNYFHAINYCHAQQGNVTKKVAMENTTQILTDLGITPTQIANLRSHERVREMIEEDGGCHTMLKGSENY